ncbi:acyl-CoA thioester hydrolase/BAAT C-terminal domain-containing protein [Streptobacillus felis]|uniref:Acyl-CoA thioesterase n=1 Tax=Streptobacillus felis TaxID=1384509 RepID=A0A7Z0PEU7_9FUSO|nr:acyl-CoA thioester hydrolase/BAAT C-terminal domain-containing protein [Streptobacillus felis]NYV27969.1 acyl-CoA thioesterase [Streptobacillus felis]
MKLILAIFKKIFLIIIVLFTIITLLRIYNNYKYKSETSSNKNLEDLYNKTIENVTVKKVDFNTFQGFHLKPTEKKYKGIVITYGGSEGSPNFWEAERIVKEGYEVLAVFMFGQKNQQKTLINIPLEQFEDVLKYIEENNIDKNPITVLGASKGAEYALNLANKYEDISNLILLAPSAYNFSGLDFEKNGSSWTFKDEELPYIDTQKVPFSVILKDIIIPRIISLPISFSNLYNKAIEVDTNATTKLIPIKDLKTNILIITGEDDKLWDSYNMSLKIKKQKPSVILKTYKNAGHIFEGNGIINIGNMKLRTGGNIKDNENAQKDKVKHISEFLKSQHNK